jgi:hypothetical protein
MTTTTTPPLPAPRKGRQRVQRIERDYDKVNVAQAARTRAVAGLVPRRKGWFA